MNITDALLTVNSFSRPGTPRGQLQALVMHWTAAPLQKAIATRDFFESRKTGANGYGSAHYVIDCDGSIIRCIPENEVAFHVGSSQIDPASGKIYTDWAREKFGEHATRPDALSPNPVTLGIEMEPLDGTGAFSPETLSSAADLAADICTRLALNPASDLCTHHMVVGWKDCPRLWTNSPELFEAFKADVRRRMA